MEEIHEMCKPSYTDNDFIYAGFMMAIGKFAIEYDMRLEDPSFYSDIEDMEIEKDEINTDYQIFPKQPDPLFVKNKNWVEDYYYNGKIVKVRKFNTKYYRVTEVKPYGC